MFAVTKATKYNKMQVTFVVRELLMMYKIQRLWSTLNETSLGCWLNKIMDVLDLKKIASYAIFIGVAEGQHFTTCSYSLKNKFLEIL